MPSAIDLLKNVLEISRETLARELGDQVVSAAVEGGWRAGWKKAWAGTTGFIKQAVESLRVVDDVAGKLKREFIVGQVANLFDGVLPLIPLPVWAKLLVWFLKPLIRSYVQTLAGYALEAFYANPA